MRAIPLRSTLQQNRLLAALPAEARSRLLPHLQLVELPQGEVIHEVGEKITHVYFPTDSIVSIMAILENGDSTEVFMTGNEGVVGISSFLGSDTFCKQAIVRVGGYAYRLQEKWLTYEFSRHDDMLALLLRYTQALLNQSSQAAICNRHHSMDQQLCRVLLSALDRLPGNEVAITHEAIASMLGVRRESVTEAAGRLKTLGLLECRRGRIEILDRPGLEKLCCECYEVVRKETARLLPGTPSTWQQSAS